MCAGFTPNDKSPKQRSPMAVTEKEIRKKTIKYKEETQIQDV